MARSKPSGKGVGNRPPAAERQVTALRIGRVSVLAPPPPTPAEALAGCLESLRQGWQRECHLASLWQAWPKLAGTQLAPHCRPLRLQGRVLTVGAAPGPWLQALQYNRHQLLAAVRAAGFNLRDLRIEQHHATTAAAPDSETEAQIWDRHPSRADVHGMAPCPRCGSPAPAGEMARWGHCSFCRQQELAQPSG
jgi:predicted nucleic acid-binding Zn ribbon protein